MRDTCEIHVSSEVIKIHAGYMRNTCGIHAGHVSRGFGGIQARPQVGLEIRILMCFMCTCISICIPYVSGMYLECITCVSRNAGQKYAKRKMLKIRKNKIRCVSGYGVPLTDACGTQTRCRPAFFGVHTQSRANRSGISTMSSRSHSCAMVRKLSGVRTRVSSLSGG